MDRKMDAYQDMREQGLFHGIARELSPMDDRLHLLQTPERTRGESKDVREMRATLLRKLHTFASAYHEKILVVMSAGARPADSASVDGQIQIMERFMLAVEHDPIWQAHLAGLVTEYDRQAFGLSLRATFGLAALDGYWAS